MRDKIDEVGGEKAEFGDCAGGDFGSSRHRGDETESNCDKGELRAESRFTGAFTLAGDARFNGEMGDVRPACEPVFLWWPRR